MLKKAGEKKHVYCITQAVFLHGPILLALYVPLCAITWQNNINVGLVRAIEHL